MKPVKAALMSLISLCAVTAASASGGLSCQADDDKVALSIESGVTRGMGGPVFNFRAQVTVKSNDVAEDLRATNFEQKHLPQYWFGDGELRMVLYREREGDKPHGYVEITVSTNEAEESYEGMYSVSVFDVPASGGQKEYKAEGPLSCFVE